MGKKVSIIIPVYNAAKYIERCARSLFEQTLKDMEFIFIDDCSFDNSISIVKKTACEYPYRKGQVVIKRHSYNKGPSEARNTGLSLAKGKFIGYCDSDDWCRPKMFEELYQTATQKGADLVWCDFMFAKSDKSYEPHCTINCTGDKKTQLRHIQSIWTVLWNTIAKKDLHEKYNLTFPEKLTYCEDFWLMFRLYYYANKVAKVSIPYYYYNQENDSSIVHCLTLKTEQDERQVYLDTLAFLEKEQLLEEYEREMSWRILKSTNDCIYHNRYKDFLIIYPGAHEHIWSCPYINVKTKLLLWMLTHKMKPLAIFIIKLRDLIR